MFLKITLFCNKNHFPFKHGGRGNKRERHVTPFGRNTKNVVQVSNVAHEPLVNVIEWTYLFYSHLKSKNICGNNFLPIICLYSWPYIIFILYWFINIFSSASCLVFHFDWVQIKENASKIYFLINHLISVGNQYHFLKRLKNIRATKNVE